MMSDIPLALFLVSVLVDGIALLRGGSFWWAVSFWTVVLGVVAAVPTACAGLVDYATNATIVGKQGAGRTATVHMLVMLTAVTCFGIDLLVRGGSAPPHGGVLVAALALDAGGAAIAGVGAWYGGELVFGHGVGVRRSMDEPDRKPSAKTG